MKKIIFLVVVCSFLQQSFSQELIKVDYSNLKNSQFPNQNNLTEFTSLTNNTEAGIANVYLNSIDINNKENTVKVLRVQSKNILALNKSFDFSNSVEIIIIEVIKGDFNLDSIDCDSIKRFKNLKYIFYKYIIDIENDQQLQKIKCLPVNVSQVYSKIFTT